MRGKKQMPDPSLARIFFGGFDVTPRMERSCSWCHTMNRADQEYCMTCGHHAHLTRMQCDCPACKPDAKNPRGGVYCEPPKEQSP